MNLLLRERFELPTGHPVFVGHFPGRPVVPGALLLDEVVRLAQGLSGDLRWYCSSVKFLAPALPGQPLTVELRAASDSGPLTFRVVHDEIEIAIGSLEPIETGG